MQNQIFTSPIFTMYVSPLLKHPLKWCEASNIQGGNDEDGGLSGLHLASFWSCDSFHGPAKTSRDKIQQVQTNLQEA